MKELCKRKLCSEDSEKSKDDLEYDKELQEIFERLAELGEIPA